MPAEPSVHMEPQGPAMSSTASTPLEASAPSASQEAQPASRASRPNSAGKSKRRRTGLHSTPPPAAAASATSTEVQKTEDGKPADTAASQARMLSRILDHHRCPITQQLLVDPVVAEDGHLYERAAIEQWLVAKERSPVTNKPMGPFLATDFAARQTVAELVEGGMLPQEEALQFYLMRGRIRATRMQPPFPPPDLAGARTDFERAKQMMESLGQSDETAIHRSTIDWMQQGVDLAVKAKESKNEELTRWMTDVAAAVRIALCGPLSQRMAEWQELPIGTRFRVIDDRVELQRLCQRPAPGAREAVNWNNEMTAFAGQICVLKQMGEPSHMNYTLRREGLRRARAFSFPYDALMLLS